MKRLNFKKLAIIAAAVVAAYTLLGFFGLPALVKWQAQKQLLSMKT